MTMSSLTRTLLGLLRHPRRRVTLATLVDGLPSGAYQRSLLQSWLSGRPSSTSTIELVISMLPPRVALLFAASCAEHVLRIFEKVFHNDRAPRDAVGAIKTWLRGDKGRKEVQEACAAVAQFLK